MGTPIDFYQSRSMNAPMDGDDEQTYRLRWEGESNNVDFASFFSSLRENEELFDVSIGCSNENGGSTTVKAHKSILAAYSPIFKDVFLRIPDRLDPFVFLKGVTLENLHHLLDFVYYGTVNITKSNIKSFLADAKELQIKGLDFGDENDTAPAGKQERDKTIKPTKIKDVKRSECNISNK